METILFEEYLKEEKISGIRADHIDDTARKIDRFIREAIPEASLSGFYHCNSLNPSEVKFDNQSFDGILSINRINNLGEINEFTRQLNEKLIINQYAVVCVETMRSRKERILNKYPKLINRPYYFLDFILKRVFPKWGPTQKLNYKLTKGRNRVISLTEAIGRLHYCGFEVVSTKKIKYETFILARKVREPERTVQPSLGAIVRLKRIGKDRKMFNVYKFRTMHPYSEYIQDYVYEKNNLSENGKIKDDFRITTWGKIFRKLWIDELPMFYNWIKGEMKLVGVRPLSEHYFNLYPENLQELRTKVYPGLVPPYYADLPESFEEIIESEQAYLEAYFKKPIRTDLRYFMKATINILFKGARSK